MTPIPTQRAAAIRLLAIALTLATAAACTDAAETPLTPAAPNAAAAAPGDRSFYWYGDERVLMDVDGTQLSVTSRVPPEAAARAVLATAGVQLRGAHAMIQARDHWILDLDPGTRGENARAAVAALRADARFGFAAPVYRLAQGGQKVILLDHVVMSVKPGTSTAAVTRLAAQLGAHVMRQPEKAEPNVWWLAYPKNADPLELAAGLRANPLVEWADPDKVQEAHTLATPTDPFYANQYYLRSTAFLNGVRLDVNAEPAWNLTYGAWSAAAGPLMVAVVDQGVQTYHPDLAGGAFVGYDAMTATWDAWGCTDCASNPNSESGHGTAVAGIIQGQHNNGLGIAGLAPAVRLMPIRIFKVVGGYEQVASDCNVGLAINNAWYNGAHVMNNSWRWPAPSNCITSAINRATTEGRGGKGTVMVFAAGNSSSRPTSVAAVTYPGNLSNVLTVSALQSNGAVSWYSSGGPEVDVAAFGGSVPGDIYTVDITGSGGYSGTDYTSTFNGTSAAAPQATAVAAMVLSLNPTLTEAQIRDKIKAGADPWGSANDFGAGKLNAYRALVGRPSVSISGITRATLDGDYTWTASVSGGAGNYTYQWEVSYDDSYYYPASTTSSVTQYLGYDDVLYLRLTVTDGPEPVAVTRLRIAYGPTSGSCLSAQSTMSTQSTTSPQSTTQDRAASIPPPPVC